MTSLHGIRPAGAPRITPSVVVGRPTADGGEGARRCVGGDEVVQPSKGGTNGGRRPGIGKNPGEERDTAVEEKLRSSLVGASR